MTSQLFIQNLYSKCKLHGTGGAQVVITDAELHALIVIAVNNLNWDFSLLGIDELLLPSYDYYEIPLSWFDESEYSQATPSEIISYLSSCFNHNNDFALFIENLSALHRRRIKYRRILREQPLPTMDQIGPRALLEFGVCDTELQAHWMTWRKWIYDIDNRSAQETGYLFEPLLASCLGGEPIGSRNSPVKRLNESGISTDKGRQVDCLVPTDNTVYEFKLRVTIAASGQGRFREELSFPVEAQAAGFKPILLVLDPTPSPRLSELSAKFEECGGECHQGDAAWQHIENRAGDVVSVFVEQLIRPAIQGIESIDISTLNDITLSLSASCLEISSSGESYKIERDGK